MPERLVNDYFSGRSRANFQNSSGSSRDRFQKVFWKMATPFPNYFWNILRIVPGFSKRWVRSPLACKNRVISLDDQHAGGVRTQRL
jgi:hypothetical protein